MDNAIPTGAIAPSQTSNPFSTSSQGGSSAVDSAVESINKNLDERGMFNDVTHSELRDINNTLKNLTPDQTNQVISRLSDETLNKWAGEINSNGIFGTGGLTADERTDLFNHLASGRDAKQLGRVYSAFDGEGEQQKELVTAATNAFDTNDVKAAIGSRVAGLPVGEARTALETYAGDLGEMQNVAQMAKYADDVYGGFLDSMIKNTARPGSMQLHRLNPDHLPKELGITKSNLVDEKTGFHAAVYRRGQGADAKYVVAFRGTEDLTDWITNGGSGIGLKMTQFQKADYLVRTLKQNLGENNLTLTGHSLGGGLANYTALKNEVPSIAFNPKGTTWRERLEIRNMDSLANQYIQNYQVEGEVLTGVQVVGQHLTRLPLLQESPGPVTKLPAIKPDGTDGNMLLEAGKETLLGISPWHDAGDHDISGPVDRHGMDYVLRGVDTRTENIEAGALNSLFDSYE